jgi:hypothetical protein
MGGLFLLIPIGSLGDVTSTPYWVFFLGTATFNGQEAPIGSRVDAYDPDSIHCGTWIVDSTGYYGYMSVYGDDHISTPTVDEGADPGDTISFRINGRNAIVAGENFIWTNHGDTNTNVDLSASGTIAIVGVDFPNDTIGAPDSTIRFMVGVRNDGDNLDFYGVTSTSARGWPTVNQDTFTYADSAETVYVYFDVIIPTWPGDTPDTITFSVFSCLDTSKHVDSTVELTASITDVGDEPFAELPGGFYLHQNYPNPFNPTTPISFTLSSRANVRLEVFDLLGRQVNIRDLGLLPLGDHSIEYDASGLPSGVYFYRLVTETSSQARKMILLK